MTFFQVIETIVVVLVLLIVAEGIRRLYFHPLAHIPGPNLRHLPGGMSSILIASSKADMFSRFRSFTNNTVGL
jgi:hypothetical protein